MFVCFCFFSHQQQLRTIKFEPMISYIVPKPLITKPLLMSLFCNSPVIRDGLKQLILYFQHVELVGMLSVFFLWVVKIDMLRLTHIVISLYVYGGPKLTCQLQLVQQYSDAQSIFNGKFHFGLHFWPTTYHIENTL